MATEVKVEINHVRFELRISRTAWAVVGTVITGVIAAVTWFLTSGGIK